MEVLEFTTLYVLFAAAAINYMRFRDALYPPVLQALGWAAILFLHLVFRDAVSPLSEKVYGIVLCGVLLFSVGSYIATFRYHVRKRALGKPILSEDSYFARSLFICSLIGLPLFISQASSLAQSGPTDSILLNVRYALLEDESRRGYGPLWYLVTISFASCAVELYRTIHGESRKRFLIAFAVACTYSIFATGRTFVILLFSLVTGIALMSRSVSPKRVVSQGIIGVIVLFLIFGYLLEKGLNSSIPLTENMPVMAMHVQSYTLGYLSALKLDLDEEIPLTYGVHTFRTVLEVLARLDLGFEARPWGQDIQNVSMQFNSEWRSVAMADHTVYQPYLKDFGILGALIIQLLIGLLHGYLYRNADQGDPFYMILYGLFLYPLLMQFFQDLYFTLLSFWIQITIVIYLHFKAPYALTRKPCNLLTS